MVLLGKMTLGKPQRLILVTLSTKSDLIRVLKVHCAAITALELTWPHVITHPNAIPGHDLSGTVICEPTAPLDPLPESPSDPFLHNYISVHRFKPGDEVFALTAFDRDGSAVEYVHVLPSELGRKPRNIIHEESACIPLHTEQQPKRFFEGMQSAL